MISTTEARVIMTDHVHGGKRVVLFAMLSGST